MYYRDHAPPHFHAVYGEFKATITIRDGEVSGAFPKRALAIVQKWRILHLKQLRAAWALAEAGLPLPKIEPFE